LNGYLVLSLALSNYIEFVLDWSWWLSWYLACLIGGWFWLFLAIIFHPLEFK
jgi:hypothetical protein